MTNPLLTILLLLALAAPTLAKGEKLPFQVGDVDQVSEISWSPDDKLILTSSGEDNALRLWEVASGKVIWRSHVGFLQDHLELYSIRHSAWTPDQRFIITGNDNGKLQLWNVKTGKLIWNIRAHRGSVTAIAVSPDAKKIVSSADLKDWKSELKVWNLADGALIKDLSVDQRDISSIAFFGEAWFKTGNGFGEITTWSAITVKPIATKRFSPCGSGNQRHRIVYSSRFNLAASECPEVLVVSNVLSGKELLRFSQEPRNEAPSFSKDEKSLLMPDIDSCQILSIATNNTREFPSAEGKKLNSNATLLAASLSWRGDGVEILKTADGERLSWLVGHPGVIRALAFSPDGKRFASGGGDRIVRLWDTETKTVLFAFEGHTHAVESVEFSQDGKTLKSQSQREAITWNVTNGRVRSEETHHKNFWDRQNEYLSPSGKLILVEEHERPFRLVDAATRKTIKEFVYIDQLDNLVFCPDENFFLAKPWWSGWQLWSVKDGKPIREFPVGYSWYNRVAFHPNGKSFITGGGSQNMLMFDLETGRTVWSLFPIDQQEFEEQKAGEARRISFLEGKKENERIADIENAAFQQKVYLTFGHYGDMTDPLEQRIVETDQPKKSMTTKSVAEAKAIWFRLHNDSPLPIKIPTQSMYFPDPKCFFEFANGKKLLGLCGNREISIWHGLEDKNGEELPYGFDFGSEAYLLPKESVLFAVPIGLLKNGNAIRFSFTFQKLSTDGEPEDFGTPKELRFREAELPKE